MEIRVENVVPRNLGEENTPILANTLLPKTVRETLTQKAISKTLHSTARLANLLPTGTILVFQLLVPIFTNQGECAIVGQGLISGLIVLCGLSCFILCFTDSFMDEKGEVYYGFATTRGMWIIDGSCKLPDELAAKYSLRLIDLIHALMSVLVFVGIAVFDQNVVNCFYPTPSDQIKEALRTLPAVIGVIGSTLFVAFPTKRHGIGFPVAAH